jgi:PhzF family phenazine biosynthesis protein
MGVPFFQVDAFTNKRFCGNPAGVCLLPVPADGGWMQNVATEMNMSETAFLHQEENGFDLRWFTPAAEVELCGHATLASAHILWEAGYLEPEEPARFHTLSGLLTAERAGDWIELDFPATPAEPVTPPDDLVRALGVTPKYAGQNQFDYLVEVGIEDTVRAMKPDFALLEAAASRGVIVTSAARSPEYDFISRFFAPAVGIDEDPVTGSAHCCLGPFWGKRFGKREMLGYQASPRGGTVRVRVEGERVKLGGQAVTVLRGELS